MESAFRYGIPAIEFNEANRFIAFQCLAPTITLAIIYWLPESPRWLLMKDRVEDARKVLLRTHSTEEALEQITQIHSQMQIERSLKNSYVHMFTKQSYRKRCLLAIGTCVFANCSGILVVNSELHSMTARPP